MQRVGMVALAVGSVLGCSEPVRNESDLDRLAAPGGSTLVLARIEDQTSEPFAVLDLDCAGGHIMVTVRDTLTLWADGAARRAMVTEHLFNGLPQPDGTDRVVLTGRWGGWAAQHIDYYGEGTSIRLYLVEEGNPNRSNTLPFRLRGLDTLVHRGAVGGACAGPEAGTNPGGDGRMAEFLYVRRR